jgi:hypothetical protein
VRRAILCLALLPLVFRGSLLGQDPSERAFEKIGEYLKGDTKARPYADPLLFIGEITGLGSVYQGVCKEAVNQNVDFTVTELLVGDFTDDMFHYGYPNCTRQPLSSPPFTLHSKVILYCHNHRHCFEPVPVTPARLQTIRAWVSEAEAPEASAAWVELRRAIRKAKLQAGNDLVFAGEIARIQPKAVQACTISISREVEINVVDVLFGKPQNTPVLGHYGSVNCPSPLPLSVRLHNKVIVYCSAASNEGRFCTTPIEASGKNLAAVKSWIAANQGTGSRSSGGAD